MFLFKLFTVFIVITAILLIALILLQEPKERLVAGGGGYGVVQRIGIDQKADFLEKATWVLIGVLLGLILLSNVVLKQAKSIDFHAARKVKIQEQPKEAMEKDSTTHMDREEQKEGEQAVATEKP